ncbi:MAG: CocE/NonD family hydrolase [Steroidobacteraceae bacterium]
MKKLSLLALLTSACLGAAAGAASPQPSYDERPEKLETATGQRDFERRQVDIPMRDGVKLRTVILLPKGARNAGMILTRTPYNAAGRTAVGNHISLAAILTPGEDVFIAGGYIRVVQDVRGKYGSEGTYVMNRPFVGSGLNPTKVDHATDTWDTIDWLVKHVPESNGKVAIFGNSYDGFTALAALVNPHPALVASVPSCPMVDGWMGDDWFHNGAFRQRMVAYIWDQVATRDSGNKFWWALNDQYTEFLQAGTLADFARSRGLEQIGFWQQLVAHPAYDQFWQAQALDKLLAKQPLKVPTMLVGSLWDQEDIYGAVAMYKALEPLDKNNDLLYLTEGPWFHGGAIRGDGQSLGNIKWDQATNKWWRINVLAPFLAHYLKGEPMDVAPVTVFQSGTNQWQRLQSWPAGRSTAKLYLKPGMTVGFTPATGAAQTADYVSDPAHPVSYVPTPVRVRGEGADFWRTWLTSDQRAVSARPDVLSFTSEVLTSAVAIGGLPRVHLTASTSGTDSDWVVKLIDVYPDQVAGDEAMEGYQFAVAMDIFRGRYRESLETPKALLANQPLPYQFDLPAVNHVFQPGHRIMVQVQSSWFPLYDRNPQTFVPNIFLAKPADFVTATQKVVVAGQEASFIELPLAAL